MEVRRNHWPLHDNQQQKHSEASGWIHCEALRQWESLFLLFSPPYSGKVWDLERKGGDGLNVHSWDEFIWFNSMRWPLHAALAAWWVQQRGLYDCRASAHDTRVFLCHSGQTRRCPSTMDGTRVGFVATPWFKPEDGPSPLEWHCWQVTVTCSPWEHEPGLPAGLGCLWRNVGICPADFALI